MLFARERSSDQAFKTRNVEAPTEDQDTPRKVHMASHGHSLVSLELAAAGQICLYQYCA